MNIIVLNSGSNGNAVYVESRETGAAVLLDCGISRKQIEARLKVHGRFPENIRGIFVTHEHRDHTRGIAMMQKLHRIPVYMTEPTWKHMYDRDRLESFAALRHHESIRIADVTVETFPKSHDAADPVFFIVRVGARSMLYATDLGTHDELLIAFMRSVDVVFLESNYDPHMLWTGSYPEDLKTRIDSRVGHLSNAQAMELIETHCDGNVHTIILGHLSENNNRPDVVRRAFEGVLARRPLFRPRVHIASRDDVSDVIEII